MIEYFCKLRSDFCNLLFSPWFSLYHGGNINVNFYDAFDALKTCLCKEISEFSKSIKTSWIDPDKAADGLAMLLPHSHFTDGGKITCNVNLWFYTKKTNPDDIPQTQMEIMEKVFNAVYKTGNLPMPILKAEIPESDYQNEEIPLPPNTGLARALIELILDFDDDS